MRAEQRDHRLQHSRERRQMRAERRDHQLLQRFEVTIAHWAREAAARADAAEARRIRLAPLLEHEARMRQTLILRGHLTINDMLYSRENITRFCFQFD